MESGKDKSDYKKKRIIAYFSMEIGLSSKIPTYSGGLGILAGDTIQAAADLRVPMIAVTLLTKKGFFRQKLDPDGNQTEVPVDWNPSDFMNLLPNKITVTLNGVDVKVQVWEYLVNGVSGHNVPVYYLDTDVDGNSDYDRNLTAHLYGGDRVYRIKQELLLGIGGCRILESMGYSEIKKYHMNEGHSAFLTLELMRKFGGPENMRHLCIFTTHTPVPAGHDMFEKQMVQDIIGDYFGLDVLNDCFTDGKLNMTLLALNHSKYVNGVAKKHGEVSRSMFPGYSIHSITNGVHSYTWTNPFFKDLFDKHIRGWKQDSFSLRYALAIPKIELWEAHQRAKGKLLEFVLEKTGIKMEEDVFTIGFARRATAYKRADLLFYDIERLKAIHREKGRIQIIYAGKAHPKDWAGKDLIRKIYQIKDELKDDIRIAYLEDYNMHIGKLITAGVDVWLNTPMRPREASGTSGMKACHNGIPNLSVLDGWWIEGHIEDVTGWSIGPSHKKGEIQESDADSDEDASDLYRKLEEKIIPMYYSDRKQWIRIMRNCIAFNASFFNTHRMVNQYVLNAYFN